MKVYWKKCHDVTEFHFHRDPMILEKFYALCWTVGAVVFAVSFFGLFK